MREQSRKLSQRALAYNPPRILDAPHGVFDRSILEEGHLLKLIKRGRLNLPNQASASPHGEPAVHGFQGGFQVMSKLCGREGDLTSWKSLKYLGDRWGVYSEQWKQNCGISPPLRCHGLAITLKLVRSIRRTNGSPVATAQLPCLDIVGILAWII